MRKRLIYDVETIRNCFVIVFYDITSAKYKCFSFIDDDRLDSLREFIRRNKLITAYEWIGYNSLKFDAQIIEFILSNPDCIANDIYNEAQRIIESGDDYNSLIPEWKLRTKNIDIYKIKHYDSQVKRTSLKWLEFTLEQYNVIEMPISHTSTISPSDINTVVNYCINDVDSTRLAYNKFLDEIESRQMLSKEFRVNVNNSSEPACVKKIFVREMCGTLGITKLELADRVDTFRRSVKPFKVDVSKWNFSIPEFRLVQDYYAKKLIDPFQTKKKTKDKTKSLIEYKWNNTEMIHGLGGLHACISPGVYESNDEYLIHDIDATSYYPFIKITNGIFPPYMSKAYLDTYYGFFTKRKQYDKKHPLNAGYKLMLNGSFGLMNEYNSPIYYPQGAMFVTINGQLGLLKLLELVYEKLGLDFTIIQCNTDGITIRYKRENLSLVQDAMKEWTNLTNINLEDVFYSKMIIRDVNNYISVKEGVDTNLYEDNGYHIKGCKYKGSFETIKDPHKNTSFKIISHAVSEYFIKGINVEDTIKSSENIFDFCGGVKKKSNFEVNLYDGRNVIPQQRITRYFVTKNSMSLRKDFNDGRKSLVEAGWNTEVLNNITDINAKNYPIDYTYYISEAKKIISSIEGNKTKNQLSLWDY